MNKYCSIITLIVTITLAGCVNVAHLKLMNKISSESFGTNSSSGSIKLAQEDDTEEEKALQLKLKAEADALAISKQAEEDAKKYTMKLKQQL